MQPELHMDPTTNNNTTTTNNTTNTNTNTRVTARGEALAKFRDLVHEFDDAMLVTTGSDGRPHARPMRIVAHHFETRDDLWFLTSFDSDKVEEIRANSQVVVTMAGRKRFVSLTGQAQLVVEQAKIEELWRESWRLWFPEGQLSPDILLIQVRPFEAEYWDQSFPQSVRVAFETVKAWVREEPIELPEDPSYHAKVALTN